MRILPSSNESVQAVLALARQNRSWKYDLNLGFLADAGIEFSANLVFSIITNHGVEPIPECG